MTDFRTRAREAEATLRSVFEPTPLQLNAHLSERFGADIWLKREDLTPVRSYKLRGAMNAMRKLPDQKLFVCASAGNHAQGVAFMCRHLGVRGVIFMPVTTPQQKIRKTRTFGGDHVEVRLIGDYFDQSLKAAQAYAAEHGGHFLSPFDDPDVIEGQASIAVEIEEQLGRAPDFVMRIMALFDRQIASVIPVLGLEQRISHKRATHVLGMEFISAEDAIRASADWLIDNGIV